MANIIRRREDTNYPALPSLTAEWDPFRVMDQLMRWDPFQANWPQTQGRQMVFAPQFDVRETPDSYIFKADLPGVKEKELDISLTGNRLTISGQREMEEKQQNDNFHLYERTYGSFSRSFTLPDTADVNLCKAELKDGVLTVVLPKRAEAQPRKVSLGSGTQSNAPKA